MTTAARTLNKIAKAGWTKTVETRHTATFARGRETLVVGFCDALGCSGPDTVNSHVAYVARNGDCYNSTAVAIA